MYPLFIKKITLTIIGMNFLLAVHANGTTDTAAIIRNIKLEFAKTIHMYSTYDTISAKNDSIKELISNCKSFSELDTILSGFSVSKKLKDSINAIAIQSIDLNMKQIDGVTINDFVNNQFEKKYFEQYVNNRNSDNVESIKLEVEKAIKSVMRHSKVKKTTDTNSNMLTNSVLATFLVIIVFSILILIYYMRVLKKQISQLFSMVDERNNKLNQLSSQISNLKNDIEVLKSEIKSLQSQYAEYLRNQVPIVSQVTQINNSVQEDDVPQERTYYFGSPQNGIFGRQYLKYENRRTLYKITTNDNIHGTFEFINEQSAIELARMSRTEFLQSACVIDNDVENFSQIITTTKGTAIFQNNEWIVVQPAHIILA